MKRLHLNIKVKDLETSVDFYQKLFNAAPTVLNADYAKWMLDDPRVNFALTTSPEEQGIEHLGIQAESEQELQELYQRLDTIESSRLDEGDTVCCYAKSNKSWIKDPQDVEWEIFHTYGASDTFREPEAEKEESACCGPDCCTSELKEVKN
jgi:catechol 2,3-dioxygenase-like lactoylglutathione lyase family enzyme